MLDYAKMNSENKTRGPNFFIIGAPKCGTTSLASWAGEHPNIFMSKPKEPRYFDTDYSSPVRPLSLEKYEKIFGSVSARHKALGEATTTYLMSREAVPNILNYSSSARFIVCLRNPIEMAQSWHSQLFKMGIESEASFETAWTFQEVRKNGENIPATCPDKKLLFYDEVCMLGLQMERLLQIVPRHQVLVIFLENMKSNPRREYRRVLEFLEVEEDGREDFPVENARKVPQFPLLSQSLRRVGFLKLRFGIRQGMGLGRLINSMNSRKPKMKQNLSSAMLSTLCDVFKEDIELLGNLTGQDLSHWLETQ